jgi:hypothetical protein
MQDITVEQLRQKLSNLRACTAVSIQTETLPPLLKKHRETGEPCPYDKGDISKINIMAGLIGCAYSNAVNNQLGREDKELDFTPQPRKWGTLMDNKMLVYHVNKQKEEKYYLQIHVKKSDKPIYLWGDKVVDVEELEGYLPKKSDPKTQANLETKVILRDVELSNIKRIKMLGETYRVGKVEDPEVASVKDKIQQYEDKPTKRKETADEKAIREAIGERMSAILEE